MAAPTQKVFVLKRENAATGGSAGDEFPSDSTIKDIEDAISVAGVFLQPVGGTADTSVLIWRETNSLWMKDGDVPAGVKLQTLTAGGSGVSTIDFLLENDPPTPTANRTFTRTAGLITQISWRRASDSTLIKTTDISRTANLLSQKVVKVYATDGTTILGQTTEPFSRTNGLISSSAKTRNI